MDQVDGGLAELVYSVDDFRVRLVSALINDEVREFFGDVYRGRLHGSAFDRPAAAGARKPYRWQRRSGAELVVIIPDRDQGLGISNGRHGELADYCLLPIRKLGEDLPLVCDGDSDQLRCWRSVLGDGRCGRRHGILTDPWSQA